MRILGLELRTVPVDDEFRMLTDFPLDDATAVVATVGTTSSTSVDPVAALADRCEEAGVWLHVDAAYAGSAAVCPEHRWCLDGVDRADSIVVNPHKWLFTPIDCSTLWTRRPEALRAAFAAHGDYLASTEGAIDFRDHGPALGRRFRALKLWTVLRCYGREGLQALIREHVRLAALFEDWVRDEPGWEVSAPRHFSTVCFRHTTADNDEIARRATETGRIFVATTKLRGQSVIRLAIGNAWTQEDDVRIAWEVLCASARGDLRPLGHARRVAGRGGGGAVRPARRARPGAAPTSSAAAGRRATGPRRPARSATSTARSASPTSTSTSHVAARHEFARRSCGRAHGAVETLARASRPRGVGSRVLSVCSEEVPAAWPETELAGLFDVETFSSDCGLMKPEPEIYLRHGAGRSASLLPSASSSATARTTSSRRSAGRDDARALRAGNAAVAGRARLGRAACLGDPGGARPLLRPAARPAGPPAWP